MNKTTNQKEEVPVVQGPALETGGTESGEIRKIVWKGAINVWHIYPIFGSGVETFAYSYYQGRPMEHNNTSEWNFLYNKAHNEYFNFLATTGVIGLGSYLFLIGATLFSFVRNDKNKTDHEIFVLRIALFAGYISILVTNFFGFSVVVINLLFFLLPALFIASKTEPNSALNKEIKSIPNKALLVGITLLSFFVIYKIGSLWYADYAYAKAVSARGDENYEEAIKQIGVAIKINPNEALYHDFLAQTFATAAVGVSSDNQDSAKKYIGITLAELKKSHDLSPRNIKLLKSEINSLSDLSDVDENYLLTTRTRLTELIRLAPTDPGPVYQLALTYAKLGMSKEAIEKLNTVIVMKPDYKIARRLLAFLDKETGDIDGAKTQLQYILKYISPNDTDVQKELNDLDHK